MTHSSNLHEDIEGWSNSTENLILTPAASEAGGTWDDKSGCHTSSHYQRKSDHGLTHESYASARHYGKVEKLLKNYTQCAGVIFKVIEMVIMLLLIGALLTTWSIPNEGDADLPNLHLASAQMTQVARSLRSIMSQRNQSPPISFKEHDKEFTFIEDLPKPWKETNPWPGKAYMIIEKTSGRAITVQNGELFLQALGRPGQEATQTANNTWLCCEENNYWAFQNVPTGRYIGHDGGNGMRVSASRIQNWEMMVARPLANGGYQLLMPHYWHTLQMIAIARDGRHLTRQIHGGAVWEFRMVQPW